VGDGWVQGARRHGAVVAVGIAVLALPAPFAARCPVHALTGLWCPTCGTTRAARHVLALDPVAAIHAQPLLLAIPVVLGAALRRRCTGPAPRSRRHLAVHVVALLLVLFTLARNVPSPAAGFLAPPDARRHPTTQGGNP
jgi:hypothetical protein